MDENIEQNVKANLREDIISSFYNQYEEDERLDSSFQGKLEYKTTMAYIHRFAKKRNKILEVGAGTGRYSIALAKEGMDVTAVELVDKNLELLKEKSAGLNNLEAFKGDASKLDFLADEKFDVTLVLGPLYHLYEKEEVNKAIDEAIRVTKKDGIIFFAFLSVYAIMFSNYVSGNWASGQEENFADDYSVRHFKEQLFTGYDIEEFEKLFESKTVSKITVAGVDGMLESLEKRSDFSFSEKDFNKFSDWYLTFSEKRELLGSSSHLLYICKKL